MLHQPAQAQILSAYGLLGQLMAGAIALASPVERAHAAPESNQSVSAAVASPVYARRTRFSGTAEIVEWSRTPPRAPRAAKGDAGSSAAAPPPGEVPGARTGLARLPAARPFSPAQTSGFGLRTDPILGTRRMHSGLDLAAPRGTPVIAAADGVVTLAGWVNGYGNCVLIQHSNGMQTRYGHLSQLAVIAGQGVRPGTVLGLVGSTGRSTGNHLHYEVRVNGRAIDPLRR